MQLSEGVWYSASGYEQQTMKSCGGSGSTNLHILYHNTLDVGDGLAAHPAHFTYGEWALSYI
jgi:hypothetical protein